MIGNQNSLLGPSFGWSGGLLPYGDHPSHCCPWNGKLNHLFIFSSTANHHWPSNPIAKRKLILLLNFPSPWIFPESSPSCSFLENSFKNLNRHTNTSKTPPKLKTKAPSGRQPKFLVWAFFWVAWGTSFLWQPSFPLQVLPSIRSRNCHRNGKLKHLFIFSSAANHPRP